MIIAVLAATFARTYLAQGLRIDSGSMESALFSGDHVLVNRFVFAGAGAPAWIRPLLPVRAARRGEVVVVRLPGEPRTLLVKRCVALPGDRVTIGAGEAPAPRERRDRRPDASAPRRGEAAKGPSAGAPIEGYFVLGDRRERSYDSRAFGAVPERDVVGKPLLVYWSWSQPRADKSGFGAGLRAWFAGTRWRRTLDLVR